MGKSLRLVPAIGIMVLVLAVVAPAMAAPPPPGLVAAYAFDEGAGTTAVDATGAGQNGAVVGATWAPGRYGGALSFDGTNDYVGLPGLGTFYNTAFTLEAWVQKATAKNDVGIVGTWTGSGPMLWVDHLASRHHLTLGGSLSTYLDSGRNPVAGQWQHLAASFDGATARYYVDGVEVANRAFSGSVGSSNTWRIGAYGFGPGGFFDGVIDEVRVYDRALSAGEILADRDQPLGLADPGAPTMPGNLAVTATTGDSISLAWTASTDDTGVAGYTVYLDGASAGTTAGTTFTVDELDCSSGYQLEVEAYDGAGNTSPRAAVGGSTTACEVSPGLVAAYAFEEGSGALAYDASGGWRNGVVSGATWAPGRNGAGLSLDGVDDHVSLGALGTFYSSGFTLEAWVKKTGAKKDVAIVGSWAGNGPMLWVDHLAGRHHLTLGDSFSSYLDSGASPAAGAWQHVAATSDGTTARYYIDGVEVASRAISGSVGNSNTWRIGAYGAVPGGFLDGVVDDVRVYNRALSEGEIQFDRDNGVVPLPVPPDTTPPSAPGTAAATGAVGEINLTWGAATDNVFVEHYNVHRSTSSGFTPSAANRIAQPAGTTFADTGLAAGATYYYKVTAEDTSGNVGPASNEAAGTVADPTPPSAPGTLIATGSFGQASLSWGAATDNVGVVRYNVHRSTTSGFTPSAANRIAQPTGTSYTNTGVTPGTYHYKVTAEDAAGNVGPVSNQASATVVADTTLPTVSITAPTAGTIVSGVTTVSANANDNAGVAGVQFRVDGVNVGAEDTTAPYSLDWNTRAVLNGSHTVSAVARDTSGNTRTSAAVSVTAANVVSLPGLRAAYPLDETSGTAAADWSGASQNGTTVGTTWTPGTYGNAAAFDGVTDRIDLPALGTFYKTGFTYEAWVRKSTTKKDVALLGSWSSAQSGGPMIWVDHMAGRYYLTLGGASLSNYLDSGRTPTVGQWEHIAATYDGTTARFYVGGVEVASKAFTGNVGNTNTWRLGAYEATPTGFFDGALDNVRIYDRALSPTEVAIDMSSRIQQEKTPPVVTGFTPASGGEGVNAGTKPTVTFNEPMRTSSITTTTFQLKDAAEAIIPATVSYSSATRTATLTPLSALGYGESYTVTVKGGAGGITDTFNNALVSDVTWSFSVEASPPQILVVTSTTRPFGSYLAEILKNEGLNAYTTIDLAFVSPALLVGFDVVVLGESILSAAQASAISGWVDAGGNLVAMRPDKQLAGLFGLTVATGTRSNAYVKVDTTVPPGAGITDTTIQYHGAADNYTLNGATAVATIYSGTATATVNPAVTLRSVGANGGQAAAFTYDLARSVVQTRQGNPSWAGQERDGVPGIRPDDMFYSSWLNTSRTAIPQADEQQRLLVNLITVMNADRMPLPRFWYLPRGEKAVVVMSGDDHSPGNAPGGTAFAFDRFKELSPPGCNVAEWECVRSSSYVYPDSVLTNAQATAYVAEGFEVALHPVVASCPTAPITEAQLAAIFDAQLSAWAAHFTSVPAPVSSRTHCVFWPDWASAAKVELARGIRLDANYYHYPAPWLGARPGFMTGGGFPMRFADATGVPIDVFQQNTNMTDESTTNYLLHIDTLLDNALGPNGYYGAFGANMHTDYPGIHAGSEIIVEEAQARGVPVISYKQLLDWVDGRDDSTIRGLSWNAGTLSFTTTVAPGAHGMQLLLPMHGPSGTLSAISTGGQPVTYTVQTIKGIEYAVFSVSSASYVATYS